MTPAPFAWPGLRLSGAPPERFTLRVERGVWGKAHGARTDYRWLAASPGFERFAPRLEFELALGCEDEPHGAATFWRSLKDAGACAVRVYPSRATDAAGRGGFLEKQVLAWRREPDLPAALAAFALLPFVARLDDKVWWERRQEVDWQRPDAVLGLEDCQPVEITPAELAAAVSSGIAALGEVVGHDELSAAYACLLADPPCAAWLRQLGRPLPPEALAALLLPLSRERGERLSLASWVPSSRADAEELESRWDVLGAPVAHRFAPREKAVIDDSEAGVLASALLAADPEALQAMPVWKPDERQQAPATAPVAFASERRVTATLVTETPTDELWPGPFELPLTAPSADAPRLLHVLWDFACRVDRRWLEPDLVRDACRGEPLRPFAADSPEADLLRRWAREVTASRPPRVDTEEWTVKSDVLRAAAIVFAPDPATVAAVGWPRSGRIPPLFFAPALAAGGRAELERRLGADLWGEATMRSRMLCRRPSLEKQIAEFVDDKL
jgi:hypothetical protein